MRPAAGVHSMRRDMGKPPVTDDQKRIMVIPADGRQSEKVALRPVHPAGRARIHKRMAASTRTDPNGMVFTIGHSNRPLGTFLELLMAHRIGRLVDVRTVPRSRHN